MRAILLATLALILMGCGGVNCAGGTNTHRGAGICGVTRPFLARSGAIATPNAPNRSS